jgi:hypothetical protein
MSTDGRDDEPGAQRETDRPASGLVGRVHAMDKWTESVGRRKRMRWLLLGEHDEPPVSVMNPIVDPDPDADHARIGICCSGGGIRSASFNLGALQAIQADERLQDVEYLAAVSGGSYIAAAFAMVAKTGRPKDPAGDDSRRQADADADVDSDPTIVTPANPPFHPGSPEEQYLRNRASYLAPTGSAKAFLVWRVLLGLLVNLALIAAVVTLVAALLSLYYRGVDPGLIRPPPEKSVLGATPDGRVWGGGLGLSALGLFMGAVSILQRPRGKDHARRFLEVWSLPVFVAGLVIFALELVVPELIDALREDDPDGKVQATNAVGAGVSATVAAIVAAIMTQLRAQIADPGRAIREAKGALDKLAPRARLALIYLATWILGPLLIFAMLVAAVMVQVETTSDWVRAAVPAVALVVLALFVGWGDLNSWSLHPFYRKRLATAFALRRVESPDDPPGGHAEQRKESELVLLSKTSVVSCVPPWKREAWPKLLVCAAANVSDPGAAPPGRGVTTFTFSADEVGGPLVGGLETDVFESALSPSRQRDFTLPAAVAMSGAAIAPSMGKATRPSIRFLMCMANVRLGVWVPNPRRIESFVRMHTSLRRRQVSEGVLDDVKAQFGPTMRFTAKQRRLALSEADPKRKPPRPTPRYLLKELLGWNSINDKFLYVTDGGHYENLGLVELLRRGCTRIYCFDASAGEPMGALGDAIALARSELGVEITFADEELDNLREKSGDGTGGDEKERVAAEGCAAGVLRYTRCDPEVTGTIVYAPTVMTRKLPWDVHAFKKQDESFPHHSTLDQLFTDQKFEAYRVLGEYAGRSAMKAMDAGVPRGWAAPRRRSPTRGRRGVVRPRVGP